MGQVWNQELAQKELVEPQIVFRCIVHAKKERPHGSNQEGRVTDHSRSPPDDIQSTRRLRVARGDSASAAQHVRAST